MKTLFVFDNSAKIGEVPEKRFQNVSNIDLFPLTSDFGVVARVQEDFGRQGIKGKTVLDSADMVNKCVNWLRDQIQVWSRELGNIYVEPEVSVKQAFLTGTGGVSTYWFSLAAEKNPLKSDLFLRIAQCRAVELCLDKGSYENCICSLNDRSLRLSIESVAKVQSVGFLDVTRRPWKSQLKDFMTSNKFLMGTIAQAIGFLVRACKWSRQARAVLGPWKEHNGFADPLLVVSYFPYLDRARAEEGHFINKYFAPLQNKMKKLKITPAWLLIFVFIDGYSYRDAVLLAKMLAQKGIHLRLVEQALNYNIALKVFLHWIRQVWRFYRFRVRLLKARKELEIWSEAQRPILDELMRMSFCGTPAMQGLYYYYVFRRFCNGLRNTKLCLYLCEMLSWEKALNAAMADIAPNVFRVGYQHTSIAQNHFFYFNHPDNTRRTGKKTDLPLPDLVAVNGSVPRGLLETSKYPRLKIVEALRQLNTTWMATEQGKNGKKSGVLLVAASYSFKETCAMVSIVRQAFAKGESVEILLKGHPSCSMEDVCQALDIDTKTAGYRIVGGNVGQWLSKATMVLVGASTVAIEALAYGCHVIVPVFSDALNMSPVLGSEEFYHLISTPEDLKRVVEKARGGKSARQIKKARQFVRRYWCLDKDLPRWQEMLLQHCRPQALYIRNVGVGTFAKLDGDREREIMRNEKNEAFSQTIS